MKRIFFIITCLISLNRIALSQIIKKPTKQSAYKNNITGDVDVVKNKAIQWFKKVYVEENLKDSYSYKPLKTIIEKVTVQEYLQSKIDSFKNKIIELQPKSDPSSDQYYNYRLYLTYYNGFMEDAKQAYNEDIRQGYLKAANKYYILLEPDKVNYRCYSQIHFRARRPFKQYAKFFKLIIRI